MLVEERGVPLSLVVTGANRHDVTQLEIVLDTIVIERPEPTPDKPHHLCADKAYDGKDAMQIIVQRGYLLTSGAVVKKSRRKKPFPGYRARRWIVEVCHSWFNRFRKLLVRFEKTASSYVALHHLAAAIICWRKIGIIYG